MARSSAARPSPRVAAAKSGATARPVWALLPAAGVGSRMRDAAGAPHKALLKLDGVPLVRRALERLFASGVVTAAVVAAHADDREAMAKILQPLHAQFGCAVHVIVGGATRQASCFAALQAAAEHIPAAAQPQAAVLFHDAARPLVTPAEIRATLAALVDAPVAVLATPVTATVKRAAPDGRVLETVPRDRLYLAQTPQAFRLPAALDAFRYAHEAGFEATDDVALAEYRGLPVKIVPGSPWNLKITTPEDLVLARALLKLQGSLE